jgi:diguanylate cyclase (GGDEF)-like protein
MTDEWGHVDGSGRIDARASAVAESRAFDQACTVALDHLMNVAPMGLWAITRIANGRQIVLAAAGNAYGIGVGADFDYELSLCRWIVARRTSHIGDVSRIPELAAAAEASGMVINAYAGAPIAWPAGGLFGTVCGFDPLAWSTDGNRARLPLEYLTSSVLDVVAGLLSVVLQADLYATSVARELERARSEADRDELTGLLNRRGWDRFLEHEEERFRRFGDPACVVVLDLDRLKEVNDTQGHDAGDRYIQRAASALAATVRKADVLARLGGDEFGIIAVGATPDQATELVARADRALQDVGVTGSFGHAPYSVVSGFPGAWARADAAMYENKRQGRRRGGRPWRR